MSGDSSANTYIVRSLDDARRAVRMAADSGYDFVKLTTNIPPEVYDAIVAEAAQRRIRLVGHVDPRVGVARALRSEAADRAPRQLHGVRARRQRALARERVRRRCVPTRQLDDARLRGRAQGRRDSPERRRARACTSRRRSRSSHLWFATQQSDETVRSRPDYAHIPPRMRDLYERARTRYWSNPPSAERRARYIAVRNRLVRAIVDSGGRSDGGIRRARWADGLRMDAAPRAGDARRGGTHPVAGARLGDGGAGAVPGRRGAVRAASRRGGGPISSLLDADPLGDIRNTTRIATVMIGGRVLERAELDASIERARRLLNP